MLNALNREHPGYLPFNAAELVEPIPRLAVRKQTILEPAQVHRLLEQADRHRDGAFWVFVLATGARLGEGLGLCWRDVNLEDGQAYIRQELQYLEGQWHVLRPKTRKSERPVPLAATACTALRRHRGVQAAERRAAGPAWCTDYGDLVFTTEEGRPLDPSNLRRRLYKAEKDAGLPQMGPNNLGRHGCASFLADQNVPPAVAMAILGHANISTTMEIYTHMLPKSMREAAEAIERALTPAAAGMAVADVLGVMSTLARAGLGAWVDGGWGVDALLGEATRTHSDLDLVVLLPELQAVRDALTVAGYDRVVRDWLPTAIAVADRSGHEVDLRPVAAAADGGGEQTQFDGRTFHYSAPVAGTIGGQPVLCVDPATQVRGRLSQSPAAKDWHDIGLLHERFELDLPAPYRVGGSSS
jgi:lincosamide nucleotidyltransferase A/C/D/E